MALNDVLWRYCRHCHRDEETTSGGLLIEHDGYDDRPCRGSGTVPTAPPPEGAVSALTVSLEPPQAASVARRVARVDRPADGLWRWPWRRHVIP